MKKLAIRIGSLPLVLTMIFLLVACGGNPAPTQGEGPSQDASGEVVKLKFATESAATQTSTSAVLRMADTLKELSGGTMELECFTDGALGGESELIDACSLGTVDITFCAAPSLSGIIPQYLLIDLPFAFETKDDAYTFLDGEVGEYLFDLTDKALGMTGLAYLENGFRCFSTTNKPIRKPEDLSGLKMRCMSSKVYMEMFSTLGASPTVVPYGELYTALQQGVVDGQENPLGNIYSMRFYEVQKYITIDNHVYDPDVLFVSNKTLGKLTDQQKEWLWQAAEQAKQESRDNVGCMTQEEYVQFFRDNGTEVIELTAEEHQAFVDATANVYEKFVDIIGEEAINLYMKALGRA